MGLIQKKIKNKEYYYYDITFRILNKTKQTNLEKYGVESVFQNKEIQEKSKQTCIKNFGVENVSYSQEIVDKRRETIFKTTFDRLLKSNRIKDRVIPLFDLNDYSGRDFRVKYPWECVKCGTQFNDDLYAGGIPRCPTCYPKLANISTSKAEKEIAEFCKQYFPSLIENPRTIIPPLELDIYIPEINLAIEFDGLFWHSEIGGKKDKNYHLNKTLACEEKGIRLIHIFEDEWNNKQDIVKSILLSAMGKITNKINSRECEIKKVKSKDAKQFLFDNHLQDYVPGISIGLYYNEELVSLIVLGASRFNKNYNYELLRYCNKLNYIVNGALSKLIKYFIENYNPKNIITYSDLRYGTGKSYSYCGFKYIGKSKPNYYYVSIKEVEKYNRVGFQKHKLNELLKEFDSNLTEWQNMQLSEYDRIWDCGNNVYSWESSNN